MLLLLTDTEEHDKFCSCYNNTIIVVRQIIIYDCKKGILTGEFIHCVSVSIDVGRKHETRKWCMSDTPKGKTMQLYHIPIN